VRKRRENPYFRVEPCIWGVYIVSIFFEVMGQSNWLIAKKKKTRGVSHHGLAIYIKKNLKAKGESWKLKDFTMQKYNLQKNPLK
jgi:hypothetical protein